MSVKVKVTFLLSNSGLENQKSFFRGRREGGTIFSYQGVLTEGGRHEHKSIFMELKVVYVIYLQHRKKEHI